MSNKPTWYNRVRRAFGWPKWRKVKKSRQEHLAQLSATITSPIVNEYLRLNNAVHDGVLCKVAEEEAIHALSVLEWVLYENDFNPSKMVEELNNMPEGTRPMSTTEFETIIAAKTVEIEQLRDAIDGSGGWRQQVAELETSVLDRIKAGAELYAGHRPGRDLAKDVYDALAQGYSLVVHLRGLYKSAVNNTDDDGLTPVEMVNWFYEQYRNVAQQRAA